MEGIPVWERVSCLHTLVTFTTAVPSRALQLRRYPQISTFADINFFYPHRALVTTPGLGSGFEVKSYHDEKVIVTHKISVEIVATKERLGYYKFG